MALPCLRAASVLSPRPDQRKLPPLPCRRTVIIAEKQKPPLQRSRNQRVHLESAVSRRDAMACVAASLVTTFLVSKPAEARRIKPETRQKIREKLNKLREKSESPKKEAYSSAGDKETPPAILNNLAGPLVEVLL